MGNPSIGWIVKNIDASIVPLDEGNSKAIIYNVLRVLGGYSVLPWDELSLAEQEWESKKIHKLYEKYGVE